MGLCISKPKEPKDTPPKYSALPTQSNRYPENKSDEEAFVFYQNPYTWELRERGQEAYRRGQEAFERGQVAFERGQVAFERGQEAFRSSQVRRILLVYPTPTVCLNEPKLSDTFFKRIQE
jgi:hypothetical protein